MMGVGSRVRAPLCAGLGALALVLSSLVPAPPAAALDAPQAGPGQWFVPDYGIDGMWETTQGAGQKVAVIDSGVDDDHENITGTVAASHDFSGSGTDGTVPIGPEETIEHGTAVAGVIAGNGSGAGPVGVAPEASILSAAIWLGGGRPEGSESPRAQTAEAVTWAVDQGATVINMSLGFDDPQWPEAWDEAFAYAYEHDVVVVACVGNRSQGATQAWSPATVPGVVGVGGLGKNGEVREASSAPGTAVDLMGPAESIPVPYYKGGYAQAEGCSFAAPVVSGIAALIRAAEPELSADEVVARLYDTARPVAGHEGTTTAKDVDPVVGHGRVDGPAALRDEDPPEVEPAAEQLSTWIAMHRRAVVPESTASAGSGEDPVGTEVAGTGAPGDASGTAGEDPASSGTSTASPGTEAVAAAASPPVFGWAVLGIGLLAAAACAAYGVRWAYKLSRTDY